MITRRGGQIFNNYLQVLKLDKISHISRKNYVPWTILRGVDFEKHFLPASGPRVTIQLLELSKSRKSDSNDTFEVSEVDGNSSDNFIDDDTLEDSCTSDSGMYTKHHDEEDYSTIINKLKRNTEKDKENKERYYEEHYKYQLEIHTSSNPALYVSEERKFKGNMATARFDQGFKDERGLSPGDAEYWN